MSRPRYPQPPASEITPEPVYRARRQLMGLGLASPLLALAGCAGADDSPPAAAPAVVVNVPIAAVTLPAAKLATCVEPSAVICVADNAVNCEVVSASKKPVLTPATWVAVSCVTCVVLMLPTSPTSRAHPSRSSTPGRCSRGTC